MSLCGSNRLSGERRLTRAVLRDFLELDLFGKDHQIVLGRAAGARTVLPAEVHEHIIALMQIDEAFPFVWVNLATKNAMILMEMSSTANHGSTQIHFASFELD